jgi:very-short-patch-repair endonuclease
MKFIPSKTLKRAQSLRHNQTEAEKRLWWRLRNRNLNGFKFVRQEPIGPFIADFLCHEKKLIVEVDGATHGDAHEVAYDEKRTRYLETRGYRVLRVQNHDVSYHLRHSTRVCLASPSSHPPFGHLPPTGDGLVANTALND